MPDNSNNDSVEAWRQSTLHYAETLAADFATSAVGSSREPFDDGSMMDPPFKATLMKHCTNPVNFMIVLTDWWKSIAPGQNGTVDSNVEYFERCYRREYRGDLAYRLLFDNQPHPSYGIPRGWVRVVVGQGKAIITNAVLGMRRSDSAVGELSGDEHHARMIKWWLPLALKLKPVKVFLCGEWAITPLQLQDGSHSTPKAFAEGQPGSNTEVKHVPHPRSWVRRYEQCR